MDILEAQLIEKLEEDFSECPFKELQNDAATEVEPEGIENDDYKSAQSEQENNGGKLGENLSTGSPGAEGTVGGPFPPDGYLVIDKPTDSKPDRGGLYVTVIGADIYVDDIYPFVMAAHHLIPGEASLAPSALKAFMEKDQTVQDQAGRSWTIECHIGYNVNGAHNGIWLPGNYAIRAPSIPPKPWNKSPAGSKSWSKLRDHDWCTHYVAAVTKKTRRQFHDAHSDYSDHVKEYLNKISTKLYSHFQTNCEHCNNNKKIAPPYLIKLRLYLLSNFLAKQLKGHPSSWKRPWYTSNKWRDKVFSPGCGSVSKAFLDIYKDTPA